MDHEQKRRDFLRTLRPRTAAILSAVAGDAGGQHTQAELDEDIRIARGQLYEAKHQRALASSNVSSQLHALRERLATIMAQNNTRCSVGAETLWRHPSVSLMSDPSTMHAQSWKQYMRSCETFKEDLEMGHGCTASVWHSNFQILQESFWTLALAMETLEIIAREKPDDLEKILSRLTAGLNGLAKDVTDVAAAVELTATKNA